MGSPVSTSYLAIYICPKCGDWYTRSNSTKLARKKKKSFLVLEVIIKLHHGVALHAQAQLALLSLSSTGWSQSVALCCGCWCMGCGVRVLVAQPFVLANIRPDATWSLGVLTAWALLQLVLCFPSLVSQEPCEASHQRQASSPFGSHHALKTSGDGRRADGPVRAISQPSGGTVMGSTPSCGIQAALQPCGERIAWREHAANPGGLLGANVRGQGRWLSWSSALILSCF